MQRAGSGGLASPPNDDHVLRQFKKGKIHRAYISLRADPASEGNRAIVARAQEMAEARLSVPPLETALFRLGRCSRMGTCLMCRPLRRRSGARPGRTRESSLSAVAARSALESRTRTGQDHVQTTKRENPSPMSRSFGLVDHKVAEAHFFLSRMEVADFYEVRWYFSAFVSAVRSITFTVQGSIGDLPGFSEWYRPWGKRLAEDRLAAFFLDARNDAIHLGDNPIRSGSWGRSPEGESVHRCWFQPASPFEPDATNRKDHPPEDVRTACRAFLTTLVELVYDAYLAFGSHVDAQMHYTSEHFASLGRTIGDAEEELFGVRGWTSAPGLSGEIRWRLIRRQMTGREIPDLFEGYLGRSLLWLAGDDE